MRLALCGAGSAAIRAHVPVIRELVAQGRIEVVGVCDRSLERRVLGATALEAPGFADVHRMLHEVEPDLLVVATPPSRHLEAVRTGLNHHAHVVCEKPLGLRRHDVVELDRLRRRHGGLGLVSIHQYEYAPPWQAFARLLRGAVRSGEPWRFSAEVERPGTDPLAAGGWRARPAVEGGILGDHAVHYVSMLWKSLPELKLRAVERTGAGRGEHARVVLAGEGGEASISVSYAGATRRNRLELQRPARNLTLVWEDDRLTLRRRGRAHSPATVEALSDRDTVNRLYRPFYTELLESLSERRWRDARWRESLGVAGLLSEALGELVQAPRRDRSYVVEDMRRLGRAVRHVLADRGIDRKSDREEAMAQALGLDPHAPGQMATFLQLCVDAGLLTEDEAVDLRADPAEAVRLVLSLDGRSDGEQPEGLAVGVS